MGSNRGNGLLERWTVSRGHRRRGLFGRQEASVKRERADKKPGGVRFESEIEDAISISTELLVVACTVNTFW